mgnify:CR=1 FL=1
MIDGIPSSTEFKEHGIDYLNLAWEATMKILVELFELGDVFDDEDKNEVWESAQRTLSTSLLLAHQASELLLKSRISEISPFLLISSDLRHWPKPSNTNAIPFDEIRTIDAQDMPKMHDLVSKHKLSDEFIQSYDMLRTKRNKVSHTVSKNLRFTAGEILKSILEITHELLPDEKWFRLRESHLASGVDAALHSNDYDSFVIAREAVILKAEFDRASMLKYFDFDKRRRAYICPVCVLSSSDWGYFEDATISLLEPNTPTADKVYCFACGNLSQVIRRCCNHKDCKGNVLTEDMERCLTCFGDQTE